MCIYSVCEPNEYLVKTGMGISDMYAAKKTVRWPFQKVRFISLSPTNYQFDLKHMSKELVPFSLPMVFTVAPINPNVNIDGFLTYVRKLGGLSPAKVAEIIAGIVHGETRVLSAKLTVREMFEDRQRSLLQFATLRTSSQNHPQCAGDLLLSL
jgi:flotillin